MTQMVDIVKQIPDQSIHFEIPGFEPDTSITVFEQEFVVHSALLRLKSAFFRQTYASIEKREHVTDAGSLVDYEFTSYLGDSGNGWTLVAIGSAKMGFPVHHIEDDDKWRARIDFCTFLFAIYGRRYILEERQELETLVNYAELYEASSAVSSSLSTALAVSPDLMMEIPEHPIEYCRLAVKLRNSILYKECMVWMCANWEQPLFLKLEENDSLRVVAERGYNKIGTWIAKSHDYNGRWERNASAEELLSSNQLKAKDLGAFDYFRQMDALWPEPAKYALGIFQGRYHVKNLLTSSLVFNYRHHQQRGDEFLCVRVEDSDLPWNLTLDW